MRKKTGKFIAVLSAFMMMGGSSLISGTIPVMAAETAVDATAELSNDALAAMQAQAAADAAASVQAAAAAGTDVQTAVAGLTDGNAAGAAETDNSSAAAPAAGSTSSAEAGDPADSAADTSGGSAAVDAGTSAAAAAAADSTADTDAVSGSAAGTESASAIAAGVASSVSGLAAVSEQVQVTTQEAVQTVHVSAPDNGWTGPVLTRRKGVNWGPSGKETYYNLNMSRVVANLRRLGYEGEYWVRDDGVKMFGQYILVAADLKKHPRGSIIETSLGTAIVADTGEFPRYGVSVDIAVTW